MNCLRLICADIDWSGTSEFARKYGAIFSGILFGAGWACWADALIYAKVHDNLEAPVTYHIPGWVATIAFILISSVKRDEVEGSDGYYEDGVQCRLKLFLFTAYLVSFGAIAGSIAILVTISGGHQSGLMPVGVGGILQTGLILVSAMVMYLFRTSAEDNYMLL